MALDVTNSFILNILSTEDTTQNIPINRGVNISLDSNYAEYATYRKIIGVTTIGPFTTPANQVYVRNLDAAATIQVSLRPHTAVADVVVGVLNPGDFLLIVTATGGPNNAGYDLVDLSLIVGASAVIEYFFGG